MLKKKRETMDTPGALTTADAPAAKKRVVGGDSPTATTAADVVEPPQTSPSDAPSAPAAVDAASTPIDVDAGDNRLDAAVASRERLIERAYASYLTRVATLGPYSTLPFPPAPAVDTPTAAAASSSTMGAGAGAGAGAASAADPASADVDMVPCSADDRPTGDSDGTAAAADAAMPASDAAGVSSAAPAGGADNAVAVVPLAAPAPALSRMDIFVARQAQGSSLPLSKLLDAVLVRINEECARGGVPSTEVPDRAALHTQLLRLANRTAHGIKLRTAVVFEDTARAALWRWEVANTDALPNLDAPLLSLDRRILKCIGQQLKACDALLSLLRQRKDEAKIAEQLERAAKALQEEEKLLQRRGVVATRLADGAAKVARLASKATGASAAAKKAPADGASPPMDAEARKKEAEAKKLEAEAKKAEREAKKIEAEAKKAEREAKKAEADAKKAERDAEREAKKAEAEAKKAEVEAKKAEKEAKKAEKERLKEEKAKAAEEKAKATEEQAALLAKVAKAKAMNFFNPRAAKDAVKSVLTGTDPVTAAPATAADGGGSVGGGTGDGHGVSTASLPTAGAAAVSAADKDAGAAACGGGAASGAALSVATVSGPPTRYETVLTGGRSLLMLRIAAARTEGVTRDGLDAAFAHCAGSGGGAVHGGAANAGGVSSAIAALLTRATVRGGVRGGSWRRLPARARGAPRYKLLQFHDNIRPAYWGTFMKRPSTAVASTMDVSELTVRPRRLTGRKPFATDVSLFNYEVCLR
jgi:hypothetical protein